MAAHRESTTSVEDVTRLAHNPPNAHCNTVKP